MSAAGSAAALALVLSAAHQAEARDLPLVLVERDDTVVDASCRVRFAPGVLADADGDGVLHVRGDGVVLELEPAPLCGAGPDVAPDAYAGVGIHIRARDVTLRGARVRGFRVGILAEEADGLVLEGCDVSGNFRQRLRSTPEAEDEADWLWPHENDAHEWRERYGAGMCVERSQGVVIRGCRARAVQNGAILDRVEGARVHDNDFSFLSGWGLALWRSSGNSITRNALDFCVRGYSHGVYNRGQDSAGILLFEQCRDNVIAENSATHGGDGFFGFSGKEALGERPAPEPGFGYERRGNAGNLLLANDFSYAAAHGIEMTFGFENALVSNRLVENGICGIWGGYSQATWIHDNELERNGELAYGLERGGVNIEHGRANRIVGNRFRGNACGVHLWWDEDAGLAATPWARANGTACADNEILDNSFAGDALAIQLRGAERTLVAGNELEGVERELEVEGGDAPRRGTRRSPAPPAPRVTPEGATRPVGARAALRGRDKIVLTEWGPYDWESPLLQRLGDAEGGERWRLLGPDSLASATPSAGVHAVRIGPWLSEVLILPAEEDLQDALLPYTLTVRTAGPVATELEARGVLARVRWDVSFFAWTRSPLDDPDAWRREAEHGVSARLARLELPFGSRGPSQLAAAGAAVAAADLPADRFGTLAHTALRFPAGRWRVRTVSDDGLRVWLDGELRIDDWTHHGPRPLEAELELSHERVVEIRVEHFELDGWAVLEVDFEPVGD